MREDEARTDEGIHLQMTPREAHVVFAEDGAMRNSQPERCLEILSNSLAAIRST
jgi:hypothetical protein